MASTPTETETEVDLDTQALEFALGLRVAGLRRELGWSQTELARRAGISRASVARLEAGQVDPLRNIRAMAGVGLPLAGLLADRAQRRAALRASSHDLIREYTRGVLSSEIRRQARVLVREHRKEDPKIVAVYVVPNSDEVRMVEVSSSVGTTREVIPFRFSGQPQSDLPFDTVLVLVSEEEYELIKSGALALPEGWGAIEDLDPIELEDAGE